MGGDRPALSTERGQDISKMSIRTASVLIRLRRLTDGRDAAAGNWFGEAQHVQSGRTLRFGTLDRIPFAIRDLLDLAETDNVSESADQADQSERERE